MYTVAAPISLRRINDRTRPIYLESLKKCGVTRVFLCGVGFVYDKNCYARTDAEEFAKSIKFFKDAGLEVGVWTSGFGHGFPLSPTDLGFVSKYQQMEGINGQKPEHAICPLDENFVKDYAEGIKYIASFHPDIIMIDDDFRINQRKRAYYFGCFCPLHLKEYYKRIGEEVPRDKIEKLIFTGGKNKYRTAYLELMRDSLLGFAKAIRKELDTVDKTIRLGACSAYESWDLSGTTPIEIAKAFAGDTKPFTRMAGAPYWVVGWNRNFASVLETYRQQYAWGKDSGIEMFSEGDTYPRPRYAIPSKLLEVFDLALICDGGADGNLAYLYDYCTKPEYETGYADRFARCEPKRKEMREIFSGKKSAGIRVFSVTHKIESWDLPEHLIPDIAYKLEKTPASPASFILARNTIPTTYLESDLPVLVYGENAKYIAEEELSNGAIIDIVAAKILASRGIDVGLKTVRGSEKVVGLSSTSITSPTRELFLDEDDSIPNVAANAIQTVECDEKAEVISKFVPQNTPASYYYENEKGQKFFVIAYDHYETNLIPNPHFENSYYRQESLIVAIERMGKKLPAVCKKNPDLYMLAAKDKNSMAIALFNLHLDDVLEPEIKLDRSYSEIRFVGCGGTLDGDTVKLTDIPAYGSVAFEVK